jgi:hypothetical protein
MASIFPLDGEAKEEKELARNILEVMCVCPSNPRLRAKEENAM